MRTSDNGSQSLIWPDSFQGICDNRAAMTTAVKICGLKTPGAVAAALDAGAAYLGFVFYPRSPRSLSVEDAERLAAPYRGMARIVALTVDADDTLIDEINETLAPDIFQLHGSETPDRVAGIKQHAAKRVMKALRVSAPEDVARASAYAEAADLILFDAKPKNGEGLGLPGGNGIPFDWRLLHGLDLAVPYMLSGGLTPENVAEAVRLTGAPIVDVSSGVEDAPGEKNTDKIRAFIHAARAAGEAPVKENTVEHID